MKTSMEEIRNNPAFLAFRAGHVTIHDNKAEQPHDNDGEQAGKVESKGGEEGRA